MRTLNKLVNVVNHKLTKPVYANEQKDLVKLFGNIQALEEITFTLKHSEAENQKVLRREIDKKTRFCFNSVFMGEFILDTMLT